MFVPRPSAPQRGADLVDLDVAVSLADAAPDLRAAAAALRLGFPALRVSAVDAVDMRDETPARRGRVRSLWLGASDGHCWSMTTLPEEAAALFVADGGLS